MNLNFRESVNNNSDKKNFIHPINSFERKKKRCISSTHTHTYCESGFKGARPCVYIRRHYSIIYMVLSRPPRGRRWQKPTHFCAQSFFLSRRHIYTRLRPRPRIHCSTFCLEFPLALIFFLAARDTRKRVFQSTAQTYVNRETSFLLGLCALISKF